MASAVGELVPARWTSTDAALCEAAQRALQQRMQEYGAPLPQGIPPWALWPAPDHAPTALAAYDRTSTTYYLLRKGKWSALQLPVLEKGSYSLLDAHWLSAHCVLLCGRLLRIRGRRLRTGDSTERVFYLLYLSSVAVQCVPLGGLWARTCPSLPDRHTAAASEQYVPWRNCGGKALLSLTSGCAHDTCCAHASLLELHPPAHYSRAPSRTPLQRFLPLPASLQRGTVQALQTVHIAPFVAARARMPQYTVALAAETQPGKAGQCLLVPSVWLGDACTTPSPLPGTQYNLPLQHLPGLHNLLQSRSMVRYDCPDGTGVQLAWPGRVALPTLRAFMQQSLPRQAAANPRLARSILEFVDSHTMGLVCSIGVHAPGTPSELDTQAAAWFGACGPRGALRELRQATQLREKSREGTALPSLRSAPTLSAKEEDSRCSSPSSSSSPPPSFSHSAPELHRDRTPISPTARKQQVQYQRLCYSTWALTGRQVLQVEWSMVQTTNDAGLLPEVLVVPTVYREPAPTARGFSLDGIVWCVTPPSCLSHVDAPLLTAASLGLEPRHTPRRALFRSPSPPPSPPLHSHTRTAAPVAKPLEATNVEPEGDLRPNEIVVAAATAAAAASDAFDPWNAGHRAGKTQGSSNRNEALYGVDEPLMLFETTDRTHPTDRM